ncbi:MAG: hypothetical protein AAF288_03215 [Planctomycetota bacterium]
MVFLNLLLLAYLIGMAAIWSTYGFFSAVVHLFVVVVAGAVAFAVWEPAAQLLLGPVPGIAWTAGLLLPFVLLLGGLRVLLDKKAKMNVFFPANVDRFGGGLVGLASGYLTAGVMVLGLSYLPLQSLLGYTPYIAIDQGVDTSDEGLLWPMLDVDHKVGSFYSMLSEGSLAPTLTEATLASARPDLAQLAASSRLRPDPSSSAALTPGSVKLEWAKRAELSGAQVAALVRLALVDSLLKDGVSAEAVPEDPEQWGAFANGFAGRLASPAQYRDGLDAVVAETAEVEEGAGAPPLRTLIRGLMEEGVSESLPGGVSAGGTNVTPWLALRTHWGRESGTFDTDNKVRLPATHARLVVRRNGESVALGPSSASQLEPTRQAHLITPFVNGSSLVVGQDPPEVIDWLFKLNPGDEPMYLLLRQTRFELPEATEATPLEMARTIGAPYLVPAGGGAPARQARGGGVSAGDSGIVVSLSSKLPRRTSANNATFADFSPDRRAIVGGAGRATKASGNATIEYVYLSGDPVVRVETTPRTARSLAGAARELARDVAGLIYVKERGSGSLRYPFAYAIEVGDGEQLIGVKESSDAEGFNRMVKLREATNQADDDATLYLYFQVPRGRTITHVSFGGDEIALDEPITATAPDYVPEEE